MPTLHLSYICILEALNLFDFMCDKELFRVGRCLPWVKCLLCNVVGTCGLDFWILNTVINVNWAFGSTCSAAFGKQTEDTQSKMAI